MSILSFPASSYMHAASDFLHIPEQPPLDSFPAAMCVNSRIISVYSCHVPDHFPLTGTGIQIGAYGQEGRL